MYNFLLTFFVWLHRVSYKIIAKIAIKKNGGIHPKHDIMQYHQFFLENIVETDSVIDIGCGKGETAYDLAKKAKHVVGMDIKANNIQYAKNHYMQRNLTYVQSDVITYNFNGQKFDKIVLSNVLEHIEYRVDFLKKLHNISDIILLRVPMIDRDWLAVYEKQQGLDYRLDPTHFIEYTLSTLIQELQASQWIIHTYSVQFGEFWGVIKNKD